MEDENIVVSTRIPRQTLVEIKRAVNRDYTSESDFFRSAIRSELFKERINDIKNELELTKDSVKAVRKLRNLLETVSDDEYETWVKENSADMRASIEIK